MNALSWGVGIVVVAVPMFLYLTFIAAKLVGYGFYRGRDLYFKDRRLEDHGNQTPKRKEV